MNKAMVVSDKHSLQTTMQTTKQVTCDANDTTETMQNSLISLRMKKFMLRNGITPLDDSDKNVLKYYDIKVELCCIAKNEELYIEDWLVYHFNLGFDHITIYDNNDVEKRGQLHNLLRNSKKLTKQMRKNIKIINCNGYMFYQKPAYFARYQRKNFDWIAFIDIDEYIVLKHWNNIKDMVLDAIFDNYEGILLGWKVIGDDNIIEPDEGYANVPVYKRLFHVVTSSQTTTAVSAISTQTTSQISAVTTCDKTKNQCDNSAVSATQSSQTTSLISAVSAQTSSQTTTPISAVTTDDSIHKRQNWSKSIIRSNIQISHNTAHYFYKKTSVNDISLLKYCNTAGLPITNPASDELLNENAFINHYRTKTLKEYLDSKYQNRCSATGDVNINDINGYYFSINKKTKAKLDYIRKYIAEHNDKILYVFPNNPTVKELTNYRNQYKYIIGVNSKIDLLCLQGDLEKIEKQFKEVVYIY